MKSCFSPLQGAGLSAKSQLWRAAASFVCARPLMFTREDGEEDGVSRGMAGGRGGLELFKNELHSRESVFLQYSKIDKVVRGL